MEESGFKKLTYLRSFFSGGDFLSQPWQMISPPLMFSYNCSLRFTQAQLVSSDDAVPFRQSHLLPRSVMPRMCQANWTEGHLASELAVEVAVTLSASESQGRWTRGSLELDCVGSSVKRYFCFPSRPYSDKAPSLRYNWLILRTHKRRGGACRNTGGNKS